MSAMEILLVDRGVAGSTVAGRESLGDEKALVLDVLLMIGWLVAVETGDALASVSAQFVLVDDGLLLPGMAFSAFAAGTHQVSRRLIGLLQRPLAIDQESSQHQTEANNESDEHGAERHVPSCARSASSGAIIPKGQAPCLRRSQSRCERRLLLTSAIDCMRCQAGDPSSR